jgi:excisionase family DNA binding protein
MLLTVADAAHYLSLGKTTIYGLVNSGELSAFKVGSDHRIPRQGLDDWIRSQADAAQQGNHPAEERRAV